MKKYAGSHAFSDEDFYDIDEYYSRHSLSFQEKAEHLSPLIAQLKKVDAAKDEIFHQSSSIEALMKFQRLLQEELILFPNKNSEKFSLLNLKDFSKLLMYDHLYNVNLDVRRGEMKFPVYYLCEAIDNWYSNYGVIIADYHQSPDYSFTDSRFGRLMHHGQEMYYIRLSPYRQMTETLFPPDTKNLSGKVDNLLTTIGEHFLSAAFHEDQIIGCNVAQEFTLPRFKEAMEVIYFTLGSDFCEVRQLCDTNVKAFFQKVYPQPALVKLLEKIEKSEGNDFQKLEKNARHQYDKLSQAFSSLLQVNITWGMMKMSTISLYKVVFSNLFRLPMLGDEMKHEKNIVDACGCVERTASEAIDALVY